MNIVDLEQQIMDCWLVVDDLRTAASLEPMNEDKIMNILLGMAELYEIKFEKLFSGYEQVIADKPYKIKSTATASCNPNNTSKYFETAGPDVDSSEC